MISPERRLESTIQALCDELYWGLRYFYAAKVLYQTQPILTPTLFTTFYFACLDQAALILSRMVIDKGSSNDDSVSFHYLFNQASQNPAIFQYAESREVEQQLALHRKLVEKYQSVIYILKDQRDRNLAHLDHKHINQPEWRENQPMLDLTLVEELYRDLQTILKTYYLWFFDGEYNYGDWFATSQSEVKSLIEYFEAYQSRDIASLQVLDG